MQTPARRRALRSLALVAVLAGCVRKPEPMLRIGTNVWIGSEPLYLARDLGRIDPKVVQLVEYPSASEVLRAYRNEAIDGMVISLDELLGLRAEGMQPRIIAVADVSDGADVVVARAGIGSMQGLAGRPIAVESGAVGAYVLSRALALSEMTVGDVTVVHLDSNEHLAAFEQGRVDAAVTFDPFRTRLLAAGAETIFDSTRIPGEIVDLIAVRASSLTRHALAIQVLLRGWFDAIDHVRRDPADAARRMSVRQQASQESFLQGLGQIRLPTRADNIRMLAGAAPELLDTGGKLKALMQEARLLHGDGDVDIAALLAPGPVMALPP
ncbi:MAG: ABC transporter substrate-binding protein [Burkholderiaceae bacterium]